MAQVKLSSRYNQLRPGMNGESEGLSDLLIYLQPRLLPMCQCPFAYLYKYLVISSDDSFHAGKSFVFSVKSWYCPSDLDCSFDNFEPVAIT